MKTHKANAGYLAIAQGIKGVAPKSVDALDERVADKVRNSPDKQMMKTTDDKLFAGGGDVDDEDGFNTLGTDGEYRELKHSIGIKSLKDLIEFILESNSELEGIYVDSYTGAWEVTLKDYPDVGFFATPFYDYTEGTPVEKYVISTGDSDLFVIDATKSEIDKIKTYLDLADYYKKSVVPELVKYAGKKMSEGGLIKESDIKKVENCIFENLSKNKRKVINTLEGYWGMDMPKDGKQNIDIDSFDDEYSTTDIKRVAEALDKEFKSNISKKYTISKKTIKAKDVFHLQGTDRENSVITKYTITLDLKDKKMSKGGEIIKLNIAYLNKAKSHQEDRKHFEGKDWNKVYGQAVRWGKKNLDNFHDDMINVEYAHGGKTKKTWAQKSVAKMEKKGTIGLFTKKAKKAGMSTTAYAKKVLNPKNENKFTLTTRREAQWMKNMNPQLFADGGKLDRYDYMSDAEVVKWAEENDLIYMVNTDVDGKLTNRDEVLVYILELNVPNTDAEGNFLEEQFDETYAHYDKGGTAGQIDSIMTKWWNDDSYKTEDETHAMAWLGDYDEKLKSTSVDTRGESIDNAIQELNKRLKVIGVKARHNLETGEIKTYAEGGEIAENEIWLLKSNIKQLGGKDDGVILKEVKPILAKHKGRKKKNNYSELEKEALVSLLKTNISHLGGKDNKEILRDSFYMVEQLSNPTYADGGEVIFGNLIDDTSDWSAIKKEDVDWDNFDKLPKKEQDRINKELAKDFGKTLFDKGGKTTIREKRGYEYLPKKAIQNLTAFLSGKQLTYQGASLLSGVYVKKHLLSSVVAGKGTAKKSTAKPKKKLQKGASTAEGVKAKIMAYALSYDTKNKEYDKFVKTKDIDALLSAGLTDDMIMACYCGVRSVIDFQGDYEMSELAGIFSMRTDGEYIDRTIKDVLGDAKNKSFQMGMKYPTYNWSFLGNPTSKPALISSAKTPYGSTYKYKVWKYNKLVLGKNVGVTNKEGEYSDWLYGEDEKKLKLSGGYVGAVSSEPKKLWNLIKNLAKQKKGYVKDVDFLFNGLGGIEPKALDKNKIKYMHGGYIESMGPDFDKGADRLIDAFEIWKEGPATEEEDIEKAKSDVLEYIKQRLDEEVTEINIYNLKSAGTLTNSEEIIRKIAKTRSDFVSEISEDSMSGSWILRLRDYPGITIYATPFWEDIQGTPVEFQDAEGNSIYNSTIESPEAMKDIKTYQDLFRYYVTIVLPWIKEAITNFSNNSLNIPYFITKGDIYDIYDPGMARWTLDWKYIGNTDEDEGIEWIDEAVNRTTKYFSEIYGEYDNFGVDVRDMNTGDFIIAPLHTTLKEILEMAYSLKNDQELIVSSHYNLQKENGKFYGLKQHGPESKAKELTRADVLEFVQDGLYEDIADYNVADEMETKYIFVSNIQFEDRALLFTAEEVAEYLSDGWIREQKNALRGGEVLSNKEKERFFQLEHYAWNSHLDDSEQDEYDAMMKKDCGGKIYGKGDVVKCGKKGGIIEKIVGSYAEIKFDTGEKDYVSLTKVSS